MQVKNRIVKWSIFLLLAIAVLIAIVYFLLKLSVVQNFAKEKLLQTLSEQYSVTWDIEDVDLSYFDEATLKGIRFLDQEGDTLLVADRLHLDIGLFSLLDKKIQIDRLYVERAHIHLYELADGEMNFAFLTPVDTTTNAAGDLPWSFDIKQVELSHSHFNYETPFQRIRVKEDSLLLSIDRLDLAEQVLDLKKVEAVGFAVDLDLDPSNEASRDFYLPHIGWDIRLDQFKIAPTEINYRSGLNTYEFIGIEAELAAIAYMDDSLHIYAEHLEGRVNDIITLREFEADLTLVGDRIYSPRLSLETDQDKLTMANLGLKINGPELRARNLAGEISYHTLNLLRPYIPQEITLLEKENLTLSSKHISLMDGRTSAQGIRLGYGKALQLRGSLDVVPGQSFSDHILRGDIESLRVNLAKLDRILADFTIPDSLRQYQDLSLNGMFSGSLRGMDVSSLAITVDDVLSADLSGRIENLDQAGALSFDVYLAKLHAQVDRLPLPPDNQVALDSLGRMNFRGDVYGTLSNIIVAGLLESDLGDAELDLALIFPDSIAEMGYRGSIDLAGFDLGVFLKDGALGRVTMTTKLDGRGIDLATIDSKIDGTITDFSFQGYEYGEIRLNALMRDSSINGHLEILDTNIALVYDGVIDLSGENSIFDFQARLDTLNLQQLGFSQKTLGFSGLITSKFSLPLSAEDAGQIRVTDFKISNGEASYETDSILVLAEKRGDSTLVDLRSEFIALDIDGNYEVQDLPLVINDLIGQLLESDEHIDLDPLTTKSEHVDIAGEIYSLEPLDVFLQEVPVHAGFIDINTVFNFSNRSIVGEIVADSFFYGTLFSEHLNISINTQNQDGKIDLVADNNRIGSTDVARITVENRLENFAMQSAFEAKDQDGLPLLGFAMATQKVDSIYVLSVGDSVVLNNRDWLVVAGNEIQLHPDKLLVRDFELTDSQEFLRVQSRDSSGNDLDIAFENFDVGEFASLLGSKEIDVSGNLTGDVKIGALNSEPNFLINVIVDSIYYDTTLIGALSVDAIDDAKTGTITTVAELIGPDNDVFIEGGYNPLTRELDYDLEMRSMQMRLLDPFLSEIIRDSDGVFSGNATVFGSTSAPTLQGGIRLQEVSSTLVFNNTRYAVENHTIGFDNSLIELGEMEIRDKNGNTAMVSGQILHNSFDDIRLDVEMSTDEFSFLNTTVADNPVFFGKLVLDASAKITGPVDLLDISVNARTLDSSAITLSPSSSETLILEEDYITFGTPNEFEEITNTELIKLSRQFPFRVKIALDATDVSELTFVIDPVTGDRIRVKGEGSLQVILHPDGDQDIFGTYTISEGEYLFSYGDFISKDFAVREGGTVRFNGNPLEALLDVDAIYSVNATTYELIQNEISIDDSEVAAAKERTDVDVYLSLDGTLLKPEIKLDLQVPDLSGGSQVSSINRKLNELRSHPNELNSQVFSLLLFDRFLAGNNAVSGFDNIGSSIALSSISNLISSELNRLAENVIKGVDLNINIDSYDSKYANNGSGGTVTEVGLEVRKRLFNDRLSISAGGNIDVNSSQGNSSAYTGLVGDFVLEYKLTESGRLRVRVFSKADYDRLLNQNTNRNGVSLFFSRSFDSKTQEDDK